MLRQKQVEVFGAPLLSASEVAGWFAVGAIILTGGFLLLRYLWRDALK